MRFFLIPLTLILINTNIYANHEGFPPFTALSSSYVTVGSEISIGFDPLQNPCLQSIPNFQGDSQYISIDSNNHIEITISALGISPCINLPVYDPPYIFYSLGVLPVGEYTVQMYWAGTSTPLPVPPGLNRPPLGETLSFSVIEPVAIPFLNFFSLLLLGVLIMVISLYQLKRNKNIIRLLVPTLLGGNP